MQLESLYNDDHEDDLSCIGHSFPEVREFGKNLTS